MLELKNLHVVRGKTTALKGISATVHEGDFITIVGPNGAGKSTLFESLSGHIPPSLGQVLLDGRDVMQMSDYERALQIVRLHQNPSYNVIPSMTVTENFVLAASKGKCMGLRYAMRNAVEPMIEDLLKPLGMHGKHILATPMQSLSGGQRQLIALVLATLYPPKLLLLDEPTAALDPQAATKLLVFAAELIRKHAITTLLVTHDLQLARALGNKLWLLEHGSLKQVYGAEKEHIAVDHLIGHVDYDRLKAL